jgi:hypothetical protein
MALDDHVEGPSQVIDIQRTHNAKGARKVIRGRVGVKLIEKPQSLLGE